MIGRLVRFAFLMPVLTVVWGFANSIGVTATVNQATGWDIPEIVKIPGVHQVFNVSEALNDQMGQAKEEVRRQAIKALKHEVTRRYGADKAALIPNDLTISEAQRILTAVARGADLSQFQQMLDEAKSHASTGDPTSTTSPQPGVVAINGTAKTFNRARNQLAILDVKGRAPMTGYSREQFGDAWDDEAGDFYWTDNGCDTRNDVLRRDLVQVTFDDGSDCEVATGLLRYERYTGHRDVRFDAHDGDYATDFDIEHVVALGNVWVTGGQQMSADERAAIANDPLNLFAADPSSNRQKGDADAATWLPSNKTYRCGYIAKQVAVKFKYGLWVTSPEKDAMEQILSGCPS